MITPDNQIKELIKEIEAVLFSDYEEAKRLIKHLLDLSLSENNVYGLYKANNVLGILSSEIGKIDDALNYYSIAMSYTAFEGLEIEKPVLLNNIGTALIINRNYYEAIDNLTNALNIILETGMRTDLIFTLYLNIADAYLHINQPQDAIQVIQEAQNYFDDENIEDKTIMLGTLANAYILLEDADKAFENILLCEEAAHESNYLVIEVLVDYYKAKYFELKQAHDDVENFYNKALQCQIDGESFYYYNQIAYDYMSYLIKRKKYEKAIPFIKKSIELAKLKEWNWVILDYYKMLSDCYSALNNWQAAVSAAQEYFSIDQINKAKKNIGNYNVFKIQEKVFNVNLKNKSLSATNERLKAVNNILKQVNASNDLIKLTEVLYGSLKSLFKIDTFALGIYDEENRRINYISKFENGVSLGASHIDYDNQKSFSAWVRRNNKPVIIQNIDDFDYISLNYSHVKAVQEDIVRYGNHSKSVVVWPMLIENRQIGLINCQALEKNTFSEFDLELIEMLSAHLAIAIENFTQKRELNEAIARLNKLSFIDSLTGVFNRQALNEYLPQLYNQAIEVKNNIVFVMIDLDNFKNLNDLYGHQEGDQCLIAFADLLKSIVGELGYIYRYGGDEFSLLFVGLDFDVVENILKEIIIASTSFYSVGEIINLTASMGAVFVENGNCGDTSLTSFINYADNALYIAKNEGKNTYKKVVLSV